MPSMPSWTKPTFLREDEDPTQQAYMGNGGPGPSVLGKKDAKAKIKDLEREVKELDGARKHEDDKLRNYLRQVGGNYSDKYNAADLMIQYCNSLMTERNRFLLSLESERNRLHADLETRDLRLQSASERADKFEAQFKLQSKHLSDAVNANRNHERQMQKVTESSSRRIEEMAAAHDLEMSKFASEQERVVNDLRFELDNLKISSHAELERAKKQGAADLREANDFHSGEARKMADAHNKRLAEMQATADSQLGSFLEENDNEIKRLQEQIKELEGDLLSQSDDFRPATDQALKSKFAELKNLVKRVTLPTNLQLGPNEQLPQDLDPTNYFTDFLSKCGQKHLQFVLRRIFWDTLMEFFFDADFGFGFLGKGEGKDELLGMYRSWLRLYRGGRPSGFGSGSDDLAVFKEDFQANKCRSAMFMSLLTVITPKGGKPPPGTSQSTAAMLYQQNRAAAEKELKQILNSITGYNIREEILAELPKITTIAGELALEVGVQRAQVGLSVAESGDQVTIGGEFYDCRNGDVAKGRTFAVELLVSPGLFKTGNGRGDMKARRALVPAEIFPDEAR